MRKVSFTLSVFVLLAMLLTACGGQQTSTNIPATNVPPTTIESTSTNAPTSAPTNAPQGTTTSGVPVTGAQNPSRLSNELKFSIVDQSGNKLDDVSDMVLDLDNTRVSYVVTASGVLIPWDSLKLQSGSSSTTTGSAQNAFVLQADPQVLQNAPKIDLSSALPAMGQAAANWDADIQNYWLSGGSTTSGAGTATSAPSVSSTSTSTSGTGTGTGTATSAPTSAPSVSATSTSTSGTGTGNGQAMPLQGVALASKVIGTTITISLGASGQGTGSGTGTSTGTATSAPTSAPSANAISTSTGGTGGVVASTATSTSGSSGTGNGLGNLQATIDDMIIETNTGMIQYIVVKTNLGNGDVLIPVPLNLVQWDATNDAFMLNVPPGILQNAPNFTEDQFPDTSTSGWDQQFSTFWQSNGGTGIGTGSSTGTGATATATP